MAGWFSLGVGFYVRIVKGRLHNYQLMLGGEDCLVLLGSEVMLEGRTVWCSWDLR